MGKKHPPEILNSAPLILYSFECVIILRRNEKRETKFEDLFNQGLCKLNDRYDHLYYNYILIKFGNYEELEHSTIFYNNSF